MDHLPRQLTRTEALVLSELSWCDLTTVTRWVSGRPCHRGTHEKLGYELALITELSGAVERLAKREEKRSVKVIADELLGMLKRSGKHRRERVERARAKVSAKATIKAPKKVDACVLH